VTVYDTASAKPVVRIDNYHAYDSGGQAIFSPDGKQFAVLEKEKVSIYNLATGKHAVGALGWKATKHSPYPGQLTFSPDGKFLALNLHAGLAGEGSAVIVWQTDTGEAVYVKSKNWDLKRSLRFVGFGPRSDCIHVTESTYYHLKERRELSFIMTGWHRHNPDGEKNPTHGKLRASFDKEKVTIVNVETGKGHATGALGWKVTDESARPKQFTFSRDGKYLALNLSSGQPGAGTAIVVWQTDTGEAVYVKSKNWELKREFTLVGFDPYCDSIHVRESTFWKLKERKEAPLIAADWARPNRDGETDPAAMPVWVNPVEVPGVDWTASSLRKK
jgi:WD40 repeat protein